MAFFLLLISSALFGTQSDTLRISVPLYSSTQFLDFDNDGDLDILICSEGINSSIFLENTGNSQFLDVTETIHIDYSAGIKWATSADINNDGLKDLIIVSTFDENLLKVFLNNGGDFSTYLGVDLPFPLLTNPIALDFDQDSLVDILLPTSSGLFLMNNKSNGRFSLKEIVTGISPDMLYIFDFDKNSYPDILAKSGEQWYIVHDFQTSSPRLLNLGLNDAFLVPFSVSTDTLPGILVFQSNGFISKILPPLNHVLTGILQLDTPLRKVLPLALQGDTVVMMVLDRNNILIELDLGKFNAKVESISRDVLDFNVIQFSSSSSPVLVLVKRDSTLIFEELSSLTTLVPEITIPVMGFIGSEYTIYQNGISGRYAPFISSIMPSSKRIFTITPDSIFVTWWLGKSVKVTAITVSPTITIPMQQSEEESQPYKSSPLKVFPNPAVKVATIRYSVSAQSLVELTINTLTGQRILDIERAVKEPGTYDVQIDISDFLPGRYIVQLKVDGETYQSKLIVLH